LKVKLLAFIFGIFIVGHVSSQVPIDSISSEDLLDRLTPKAVQKTRSLGRSLVKDGQAEQSSPSVDLVIQFEFGSAKILDESKPLLNKLATVMNADSLSRYTFNVEGHTDSVGSDAFNQQLSEKRASAIVNYLASKGVSKTRLIGIGKGSSSPLVLDRPDASENRRVRIIVNS
jgi:outer membrane protein OmpA-like peptidoglycan-associated protein